MNTTKSAAYRRRDTMNRYCCIAMVCAICWCIGCGGAGPTTGIESTVPQPGFAEGWRSPDGIMVFDKDTIFEHINGEAEIFFPYGFTEAVTITYRKDGEDRAAVIADVYAMGSPSDALGIYSKITSSKGNTLEFATADSHDEYQLIFCRDKYFVRITALGKWDTNERDLLICGAAIADLMPQSE
jgi:hypothetical protein